MVYKHQTDKVKQYVVVVRWFTHGPWMDGLKLYTEKCSKLLHWRKHSLFWAHWGPLCRGSRAPSIQRKCSKLWHWRRGSLFWAHWGSLCCGSSALSIHRKCSKLWHWRRGSLFWPHWGPLCPGSSALSILKKCSKLWHRRRGSLLWAHWGPWCQGPTAPWLHSWMAEPLSRPAIIQFAFHQRHHLFMGNKLRSATTFSPLLLPQLIIGNKQPPTLPHYSLASSWREQAETSNHRCCHSIH